MIGSTLSLVIELLMAMLLVVTISYCFVVNRKLTALRTDQSGMRHVISELNRSTERAESAIRNMRQAALMVEGQIAGQMNAAQQASEELGHNLERSKELREVAKKLSDIDVGALRALEKEVNPAAISAAQVELTKKLKRQRLGFGQNRFVSQPQSTGQLQPIKQPQSIAQGQSLSQEQPQHRYAQRNDLQRPGGQMAPPPIAENVNRGEGAVHPAIQPLMQATRKPAQRPQRETSSLEGMQQMVQQTVQQVAQTYGQPSGTYRKAIA